MIYGLKMQKNEHDTANDSEVSWAPEVHKEVTSGPGLQRPNEAHSHERARTENRKTIRYEKEQW